MHLLNWNELSGDLSKGVEASLTDLLAITHMIQSAPELKEVDPEKAREISGHLEEGLERIQTYLTMLLSLQLTQPNTKYSLILRCRS
jgi:hypothetical protein